MPWTAIGQLAGGAGGGAVWTTGHGAPVSAGAHTGDMYLDVDTENVYRWGGVSWALQTNIKGDIGATGPTGPTGPQGVKGDTGDKGPLGPTGSPGSPPSSWLTGTNEPGNLVGKAGDFFLQTDIQYEPVTKLIPGPPGPPGRPGVAGPPGPTGPRGIAAQGALTIVHMVSSQTIPGLTTTAAIWDTLDVGSLWSAGSPTKFIATASGWYQVCAWVHWDVNSAGVRIVDIRKNGTTYSGGVEYVANSSSNDPKMLASSWVFLDPGDYVECTVFEGNIGTVNITEGQFSIFQPGF